MFPAPPDTLGPLPGQDGRHARTRRARAGPPARARDSLEKLLRPLQDVDVRRGGDPGPRPFAGSGHRQLAGDGRATRVGPWRVGRLGDGRDSAQRPLHRVGELDLHRGDGRRAQRGNAAGPRRHPLHGLVGRGESSTDTYTRGDSRASPTGASAVSARLPLAPTLEKAGHSLGWRRREGGMAVPPDPRTRQREDGEEQDGNTGDAAAGSHQVLPPRGREVITRKRTP